MFPFELIDAGDPVVVDAIVGWAVAGEPVAGEVVSLGCDLLRVFMSWE